MCIFFNMIVCLRVGICMWDVMSKDEYMLV